MSWRLCREDDGAVILEAPSLLSESWWLCHTVTQERKRLAPPRGGSDYLLDFDEDGRAFLDDSGGKDGFEGFWASDLFAKNLYHNDSGDRMLFSRGGKSMSWDEFVSDSFPVTIVLLMGSARVQSPPIRAGVFRLCSGCRIWWAIGDLYKIIGMRCKQYPSRWVAALWRRWERFADAQLRLDQNHMRSSNIKGCHQADGKVLDYASVSTVVLLGLLVRFVAMHRGRGWGVASGPESRVLAFRSRRRSLPIRLLGNRLPSL